MDTAVLMTDLLTRVGDFCSKQQIIYMVEEGDFRAFTLDEQNVRIWNTHPWDLSRFRRRVKCAEAEDEQDAFDEVMDWFLETLDAHVNKVLIGRRRMRKKDKYWLFDIEIFTQ